MTNYFTQAQAATVQDGGQTFCTLPAIDVKPVRVPPAGSSLGECAHFDALGNALQARMIAALFVRKNTPSAGCEVGTLHLDALGHVLHVGDTVQFADWMPVEVITALLPGGRFAHGEKTNFCCVVRLVEPGSYPWIVNALSGRGTV